MDLVGASMILLLIAAALAIVYLPRRLSHSPRLSFTILPPYDIPDLIRVGGVMVENRGRVPAPNVKVDVQYAQSASRIQHMHVESDEPFVLRGGGEQYNFAAIRLRELGARKRIFIYWAAGSEFQPNISVTSAGSTDRSALSRLRETFKSRTLH